MSVWVYPVQRAGGERALLLVGPLGRELVHVRDVDVAEPAQSVIQYFRYLADLVEAFEERAKEASRAT